MNTKTRIRQLLEERGWTEYRLSKESGLAQTTISNIFKRNTEPTIPTLEAICVGFGITLAQFFSDGTAVELTQEQRDLFDRWVSLTAEQKKVLYDLIKTMN